MPKSVLFELKLKILALAVFFLSLFDCWEQILPNLTFKSQKLHISGHILGKIQVPLCQNLYFLRYRLQILAPAVVFGAH